MKKKSDLWYILLFLGILVLSYFFSLTGEDLLWSNVEKTGFIEILKTQGIGVLPSLILFFVAKIKIVRILFMALMGTSLVILMKNIVNKRNVSLGFIALFLILLSDKLMFAHFFVNTTGFTVHLMGSFFTVLFMKLFINNSVVRMKKISLIGLGLVGGTLFPLYSFIIFVASLVYMLLCRDAKFRSKYLMLIMGEVIGLFMNVMFTKLSYQNFASNLIHEFMSNIRGANFLCLLIFVSFVLFLGIKVFVKGKRLGSVLSMVLVSVFLFNSLMGSNDILTYLSYIGYFGGSFYILLNSRENKLFKYKVVTFYLFKIMFIILLCLIGNIDRGSVILLYLIDMLLILETYNMWFPVNFLKYVWIVILGCVLGVNIYIYYNVNKKYVEMNRFIKNELECNADSISLPNRYDSEYLYKVIPETQREFLEYIKYYEIDLYVKNRDVSLKFTK